MGRRPKSLWSQNPGSQPVRLVLAEDDKEEAELICDEMLEANRKGDKFDDMAVLFRTNDQSRILESEFRKKKIPYRIVGARSFFDRREVKDILAYLHVMANPDDDVSLLRILNTPTRGIGTSTADLARDHSIAKKTSIYTALKDPAFQALLTQRMQMLVGNFIDFIDLFKAHAAQPMVELAPLAEKLIVEVGYRDYLAKLAKTPTDVENWEIGLKMLKQSLTWFDERDNKGSLQDFLDETSLNDDREEKDDITKKTGVCLITMHASKGLEFPIVWLPGLEEGILPHKRSIEEGTKDEERRLFYVGITRAMRRLTLSHCRYRMKWGQKQTCMPSSFLKELDKKHVEVFDHAAYMKEDLSAEDAADFFASLRRQMS